MKLAPISIALSLFFSPYAAGDSSSVPAVSAAPGIESRDYEWNRQDDVLARLLRCTGDRERGQVAYEVCRGCHKNHAEGRPDAGYPQLAGQHVSVLVKQMVDVRRGLRDNPRMHPFIEEEAVPLAEIPDMAAYLHSLKVPSSNRKGPGGDLEHGRILYQRDCASCHGEVGEGDAREFYPKVASQHYPYLYRESIDIRDGMRRNANPKMVKVLKRYSDEDIEAVSDYMSRQSPVND